MESKSRDMARPRIPIKVENELKYLLRLNFSGIQPGHSKYHDQFTERVAIGIIEKLQETILERVKEIITNSGDKEEMLINLDTLIKKHNGGRVEEY